MNFRAFVALPVPDACRDRLAGAAVALRGLDKKQEVRWTEPVSFHVTLAFLDDIHVTDADRLMTLLRAEVAGTPPFRSDFSHVGYFPANARPRLVLAHLAPDEALSALHNQVLRAVRAAGLQVERRAFMPHVTLGRLRGRRTPWLEIPPSPLHATLDACELHLYRSDRGAEGARYRIVQTAGLSGDSR